MLGVIFLLFFLTIIISLDCWTHAFNFQELFDFALCRGHDPRPPTPFAAQPTSRRRLQ